MPEKATRRSVKKSRGGCSRCKAQHLKCDEQRPACGRCERLSLECPGYTQPIKWSSKHEVRQRPADGTVPSSSTNTPPVTHGSFASFSGVQDFNWLDFTMTLPSPEPSAMVEANNSTIATTETQDSMTLEWPIQNTALDGLIGSRDSQVALRQPHRGTSQTLMQSLGARTPENGFWLPRSLLHEPYELISYYFKTIPALYSTFDSPKNPFRSSVQSLFSHSLAVNLAAQSMAAACLVEVHPRFVSIGSRLRRQALEAVKNEPDHNYDVLLALIMSGPTGNWFKADDLGIASYHAMRDRLDALAAAGLTDQRILFFQEAMVMWELFLAYANPSVLRPSVSFPPMRRNSVSNKYETHSWNGVARDTLQIVRDVGRLVRGNRLRSLNQRFVSQAHILQLSADLVVARGLEQRLLDAVHPAEADIAPTEDAATPVWHITTMAELFRYVGLLQLYRVFPDLLSDRLLGEQGLPENSIAEFGDLFEISSETRNEWLTAFASEGLRLLESLGLESGTKDFQPFLLVSLASELVCRHDDDHHHHVADGTAMAFADDLSDTTVSRPFAEVAMMRKFVLDRLTAFLRLLPPKPIRVCLDIIKETWRRMDEGQQDVYWLDVMIENGWETIMA